MEKIKIIKGCTASFDVDAQKCFTPLCPNELPVPEGDQIVEELNKQATFAKVRIGSKDAHSPQAVWVTNDPTKIATPLPEGLRGPNVDFYWPVHAVPSTKGFELLEGLPTPKDYDYFVWKGMELDMHPYGACFHDLSDKFSTGIIEYLKSQYITHVIVAGLATDFCVFTTAKQLINSGFKIILNKAGCRGISPEGCAKAISDLTALGAIIIESSDDLILSQAMYK